MVKKIGNTPPGIETVKHIIEQAGKPNRIDPAIVDEFNAVKDSIEQRQAEECDAASKLKTPESPKTVPPLDPAIDRMLREKGIKPTEP